MLRHRVRRGEGKERLVRRDRVGGVAHLVEGERDLELRLRRGDECIRAHVALERSREVAGREQIFALLVAVARLIARGLGGLCVLRRVGFLCGVGLLALRLKRERGREQRGA